MLDLEKNLEKHNLKTLRLGRFEVVDCDSREGKLGDWKLWIEICIYNIYKRFKKLGDFGVKKVL